MPGFLWRLLRVVGYLHPTVREIERQGGRVEIAEVWQTGSVLDNAKIVSNKLDELISEGRKVRIVAHSKGVPDALAALTLNQDRFAGHVDGVVAIQGDFRGASLGNFAARHPRVRRFSRWAARKIEPRNQGIPGAVDDLASEVRDSFNEAHPYPAHRFPTVGVATSRFSARSVLFPLQLIARVFFKEKSDGLAEPHRGEIPGAQMVRLDDMDHAESTMWLPFLVRNYSARRVTRALMTVLEEVSARGRR